MRLPLLFTVEETYQVPHVSDFVFKFLFSSCSSIIFPLSVTYSYEVILLTALHQYHVQGIVKVLLIPFLDSQRHFINYDAYRIHYHSSHFQVGEVACGVLAEGSFRMRDRVMVGPSKEGKWRVATVAGVRRAKVRSCYIQ